MNVGKLNKRITIQEFVKTEDPGGGSLEEWVPVVTVWASIRSAIGKEKYTAMQIEAVVDTEIRIRYRKGVSPVMRVSYGEKLLNIRAVFDPDGRGSELILLCEEERANGS